MVVSFHALSVDEVLLELNTSKTGLSNLEVIKRLKKFGANEIKQAKKISVFEIFLSQFKNVMIYMLFFAIIISFMLGEITDTIVIGAIIILNAVLGFIQEYKAERSVEALLKLAAPKSIVIRDSNREEIWSKNLVPGDIVLLDTGDRVPANVRLIESYDLKVDQSHLTGESVSVLKHSRKEKDDLSLVDRNNMIFMGSLVTYGKGKGVVTATGMNTEVGEIAENVQTLTKDIPPLQNEIEKMSRWLAIVIGVIIALVFVFGVIFKQNIFVMFMTSISLAVSAVPEGLPAVITVTLALGMQRMARKNAIVRKLSAVQTLGNVTVICSDKTGTMTKNEMTVTHIFDGVNEYRVTGTGYNPKGEFFTGKDHVFASKISLLLKTGALCNNATLKDGKEGFSIFGDPTEGSLIVLAAKAGISEKSLSKEYEKKGEVPFSSERKMMSVIYEDKSSKKQFVFSKGAPDILLNLCSKINNNDKIIALTDSMKKKVLEENIKFASSALRVLALAYKPLSQKAEVCNESLENDLIFLGLVGMIDPPRNEVKEAIKLCKTAGIRVMMLTGDHLITAKAIGEQIGLVSDTDIAVSATDIDSMDEHEFRDAVSNASIFARVSSENKLNIVKELKRQGEIVAVTGDGVNDASALKSAHIGVAMGIKGTDVTKEASDIILTDDNFSTIVNAVKEGRGIFENIKKFIKFLLAANFGSIVVVLFMILFGIPIPYLPLHILWLNLITDGLPAIALSVEPTDKNVMRNKPRDPNKTLIGEISPFIIVSGIVYSFVSIVMYILVLYLENYFVTGSALSLLRARTAAISQSVIYELFLVFNCRDDKVNFFFRGFYNNFVSNLWLTGAVVVSVLLQLGFVFLPFFQQFFNTAALTMQELGVIFVFSTLGLFLAPGWLHKDPSKS
ncbi:Potassium-transporting ATPase ATP-binding subunit [Candidatus Tiddalikarchaeum anstoanum]|nr:Potassium-transporting ATPase ATP-binding subunit [Candidatus Tiddalikarchaeum anstoanum]